MNNRPQQENIRQPRLLSIVFSFRNEAKIFDELFVRMRKVLEPLAISYEMIFVNDDSTDNSLEILQKYAKEDARVKVINMSRRFGVAPCLMAGLKATKGDAVVFLDTDLQDPPELIPKMLEKYKYGADVVNMTRTKRHGENAIKMYITKLAYRIINFVSNITLPENTGDFKLLSRRAVDELIKIDEYDPFMRGICRWIGFEQVTIFYEREPRFAGETQMSIFGKGPAKEFIRGITSFSSLPLYCSLYIGFIVSFVAFINLIIILIKKFSGASLVDGWTAIMSSILFIGGSLHIVLGFIGIYIGKIYDRVRNRPQYIISGTIGIDDIFDTSNVEQCSGKRSHNICESEVL